LNFIFFCALGLFISSCNNSQSGNLTAAQIATFDSCLNDCAAKEQACWDEFNKCKGIAATEEQAALATCSHLPPNNQAECKNEAITAYIKKVEQCEENLKLCLGQLSKCREACGEQFRKLPDTQ
jgi:hypothetical protein